MRTAGVTMRRRKGVSLTSIFELFQICKLLMECQFIHNIILNTNEIGLLVIVFNKLGQNFEI